MLFIYISLHSSTNSLVPFAPSTFQNSAGIPSGPIALLTFSASIAFVTSLSRITRPFESSSTSSSNSHLFILRFSILVIQSLDILLPSVPYLFWFCQQFSCLILYCFTCIISRFLSRQLSNLCIH